MTARLAGQVGLFDLPPAKRAAVMGKKAGDRKRRYLGLADGADPGNTWRCHRCGQVFRAWTRAEAHADQPGGHYRLTLDLTE